MSLWKSGGEIPSHDVMGERIAAGTVGGNQIVPSGIGGGAVTSFIDDADPRILYGISSAFGGTGDFIQGSGQPFNVAGTSLDMTNYGDAAQLTFYGNTIGIIAATNPQSGRIRVYIDGNEIEGRSLGFTRPSISGATLNVPVISATATSIVASSDAGTSSFRSTGKLLIGNELISYTGLTSNTFTGCVRGIDGTVASSHTQGETIYSWGTGPTLFQTSGYGLRRMVFYNPFLSLTTHKVTVVADNDTTNGTVGMLFDGFVVGPQLGSQSIAIEFGTAALTFTTDGNGHADNVYLSLSNTDVSVLSIVGYTQTSPSTEASNTTSLARLGLRWQTATAGGFLKGTPVFYIHNGPLSTSVTLLVTIAYLGQTT